MSEEHQQPIYLYGASVQGIQSFIMSTNDLKSIIGASELVEQACSTMFDEFTKNTSGQCTLIVNAAGNIKVMFDKKEDCQRAVLEFPRKVMTAAPGITISQAVVPLTKGMEFGEAIDKLENRLRNERNRPSRPIFPGVMGMLRSRKTGQPAVKEQNGEYLDLATVNKVNALMKDGKQDYSKLAQKFFPEKIKPEKITTELGELTGSNDWLAIIHADGNGFGLVVQEIGKHEEVFPLFSKAIDECTSEAAQNAFEALGFRPDETIPFRPIVLSGDDMTAICRADYALEFTRLFLNKFHEHTKDKMSDIANGTYHEALNEKQKSILKSGLTACAGIAYMKSSYPFYYGYELAETLCGYAKKDSKSRMQDSIIPSSLAFYRINDSFIHSFEKMKSRELEIASEDRKVSFFYGPYYLAEQKDRWKIDDLQEKTNALEKMNNIKSDLRHWISLMYRDSGKAEQFLQRACSINSNNDLLKAMTTARYDGNNVKSYPAYDVLSCFTIKNQQTRPTDENGTI